MARGWESKAVESQIEGAAGASPKRPQAVETPAAKEKRRKLQELDLARRRVLGDLGAARHPRHRELLERTLTDLDARIAALGREG